MACIDQKDAIEYEPKCGNFESFLASGIKLYKWILQKSCTEQELQFPSTEKKTDILPTYCQGDNETLDKGS